MAPLPREGDRGEGARETAALPGRVGDAALPGRVGNAARAAQMRDAWERRGRVRWVVDAGGWVPSEDGWASALAAVSEAERAVVGRFRREPDRRRALVARLLVRALCAELLGFPDAASADVRRTPEGKPYLAGASRALAATAFGTKTFNFNLSHHGDLVCLAAEPTALVGVDVMSHTVPAAEAETGAAGGDTPAEADADACVALRKGDGGSTPRVDPAGDEFFSPFQSCYTANEWALVFAFGERARQMDEFYRLWTLKESLVKAIGLGLGFELQRAEFSYVPGREGVEARVAIDGVPHSGWRFFIHETLAGSGERHWICVAHGPLAEACPSFLASALPEGVTENGSSSQASPAESEEPPFRSRAVSELVASCAPRQPDHCLGGEEAKSERGRGIAANE